MPLVPMLLSHPAFIIQNGLLIFQDSDVPVLTHWAEPRLRTIG